MKTFTFIQLDLIGSNPIKRVAAAPDCIALRFLTEGDDETTNLNMDCTRSSQTYNAGICLRYTLLPRKG